MAHVKTGTETERVLALLGGKRVFRRRLSGSNDIREELRRGLPFAAFDALLRILEVRPQELASVLGVAARTLARRKMSRQLSPIESDRLYRIAFIAYMASEVLGSIDKARTWLQGANRALGGHSPISRLDTEIGERQVEDLLNRINYGIVS